MYSWMPLQVFLPLSRFICSKLIEREKTCTKRTGVHVLDLLVNQNEHTIIIIILKQPTQTNIKPFALAMFSRAEVAPICFSAEASYASEYQKRECLLFSTDRVGCVSLI